MSILRQELRTLAGALAFFTRLPLPASLELGAPDLQRAITYFPLCGAVVGAVSGIVWWLAALVWPPAIATGFAIVASVILTGALHEDGWADVCDGFGGGHTKARVLEIMKDSRIGAYGVIGLVLMVGLKWQALAAFPATLATPAFVAAHALSRGLSASLMATLDYVRPNGPSKARALIVRLQGGRLVFVVLSSLLPLLFLPPAACWTIPALVALRLVLARWFRHRIGGYTGDCLGAAQQLGELVCYLVLLGLPS